VDNNSDDTFAARLRRAYEELGLSQLAVRDLVAALEDIAYRAPGEEPIRGGEEYGLWEAAQVARAALAAWRKQD
jgi:hypothetical protein